MKTINVDDIPKPVVVAMEAVVEVLRQQLHRPEEKRPCVKLPLWPGKVIGTLSRTELYQDVQ